MDVAQDALDKLLDLIGGDQDSLAELIESFLEESPLLVEQMRRAAESGDRSGLGRAARGTSAPTNFPRFARQWNNPAATVCPARPRRKWNSSRARVTRPAEI